MDAQAIAQAVQAEIARQTEAGFAAMSADELTAAVAKLEEQLAKAKAALAANLVPVAVAQKAADPNSLPELPWGSTRARGRSAPRRLEFLARAGRSARPRVGHAEEPPRRPVLVHGGGLRGLLGGPPPLRLRPRSVVGTRPGAPLARLAAHAPLRPPPPCRAAALPRRRPCARPPPAQLRWTAPRCASTWTG